MAFEPAFWRLLVTVPRSIYVEDVDSFRQVRDVNPSMVAGYLKDGYFDIPEDTIQMAFGADSRRVTPQEGLGW